MKRGALRDFRRPRLWLGLWIAALFATVAVCLLPLPRIPVPLDHFDKLEHALGYAVLSAYAAMLFATRGALGFAVLGLFLLGLGIEGLQAWVPWRSADPIDLLANMLGSLLGMSLAWMPAARWLQRVDQSLR